ncbi:RdgB/HAM1 family non-canonical purine NTP pyrophosphatase [Roseitranquillus sediminis]|uniref:RdgB/HAM1 family non-canonical purine NTP pyrophosphatase n=1 Tax=Roseitranquillus sediminis TaxID=2809051 RepID=UPI001D0CA8D2|nr:RdgB/HAM1 family non-canonical purine NTP pyrophosphatase [Roseitranquillus sediminis]MBM9593800.1 RdgB/HAM1 family non-canonical purine NTP pyrophosphatase [Roseitranquillus sediminis]
MRRPEKLVLATQNPGKIRELRDLLAPCGIEVVTAPALSLAEPEETEDSFAGNARIKAHAAARASGLPALSDDSGLEVDALDGAPGVRTADWAETPAGRDFPMAMRRVHDLVKSQPEPWRARFRCTLCLAWPDGTDEIFEGAVEGRVVWPMRGENGFGFDPIFVPDGDDRTFAEMSPEEKHAIDHRARAFEHLVRRL